MIKKRSQMPRGKLFNGFLLLLFVFLILILLPQLGGYVSNPGDAVEGCAEGCSQESERKDGPLRIASLNMLHGFPFFHNLSLRVHLIAEEIKRLDADIILLQEVPWTKRTGNISEELATQLGYNYIYYRANGNRQRIGFEEGEAILSRFPLKNVQFTTLFPRAGLFQNRVALGASVVTPWGEINAFSVHLTNTSSRVNVKQVEALKDFVEMHTQFTGVIGGDFNAKDNSPQIKSLEGVWIDTYRTAHPNDEGYTCCIENLTTPGGPSLQMRIDYLFLVNPSWKLTRAEHAFYAPYQVGERWQWVSDHTGLVIEVYP